MKRFVTLLLTVCMLLTLVPTVFAAEESLPDVKFSAEYVESEAYFKLTVAVTVNDYKGEAWVRVGAFKDEILQKLVLNEKIDTSSLAHSKTMKYDIIMETEKPQDYVFKCFTFEENMRPLLPVSVINGESAINPIPENATKLKGIVRANSVTDIVTAKNIDTTGPAMVKIVITDNYDTDNKDFAYVPADSYTGTPAHYTHNGEFLVGKTNAEDYLGMAVIFYVVENEAEDLYEIIFIEPDPTKNETLTFTLDRFDKVVGENGVYNEIRYYANATDTTSTSVAINDYITTVYNNVGGFYNIEDVLYAENSDGSTNGFIAGNGQCKNSGQVTLIDYNDVKGYDVAFIEVAATTVVKKATEAGVSFKKGINLPNGDVLLELLIDAEDIEKKIVIKKDGVEIPYTDLKEWDVLSIVTAGENADYILAEVVENSLTGTVSATYISKTSAGNTGYVINGEKYDVALGAYNTTGLEVGDSGIFYIDKYGKIAAYQNMPYLSENYGFVTKAVVTNDQIDGKGVKVQMLTTNGIEVFDLATSVSYKMAGGTSLTLKPEYAPYTGVAEDDAETFFGTSLKGQIIYFEKNSYNRINGITLANYDDRFETANSSGGVYDEYNGRIGTTYIDSDALIFFVNYNTPGNASSGFDVNNCAVGTLADLADEYMYSFHNNTIYCDSKAIDYNIVVIEGVDVEIEEDVTPAWEGYGFVTKAIVENDEVYGKTVKMQILSETGEIEVLELASSVSYERADGTRSTLKPEYASTTGSAESDADMFFGTSLKEQVIKYSKTSDGKICAITMADYDTDKFCSNATALRGQIFDAENNKLGTAYLDSNSIIFFVDGNGIFPALGRIDADKCMVGSVADLEDEVVYDVIAIYADDKAADNNIVVIRGGLTAISPSSSAAVITKVAVSEVEGEKIYSVSYLFEGEECSAETVAYSDLLTNYSAPGSMEMIGMMAVPTVGDVVKLKINPDGKIVNLTYLFNMTAAVRANGMALSYDLVASAGSYNYGEFVDAGYAVAYREASEIITLNSGNDYKLSQAENVYVVDATGRAPSVKTGSSVNYRYYEALYSDEYTSTIKVDGTVVIGDLVKDSAAWTDAVQKYTDYVFVRLYDGRVKDVVVVKGMPAMTVSPGNYIFN